MTKNELIVPNSIIETIALWNNNIRASTGLKFKLAKLVSVSLICSSLYMCTANAAAEQVQKAKEKIVTHVDQAKQKVIAHVHRDTYLKSGAHMHEDVYVRAKPYIHNSYVKFGAGAMYCNKFKHRDLSYTERKPKTTPIYILGIGRHMNDSVRTDLNVQFAKVHYKSGDLSQIIKTRVVFVNGYYDINPYKNVVPYITAGVGVGSNKAGSLKARGESISIGKDVTNFIWNVGVGAMIKSEKNFGLDLVYRYMHLGHMKTNDSKSMPLLKGGKQIIRGHQIIGSLVYQF